VNINEGNEDTMSKTKQRYEWEVEEAPSGHGYMAKVKDNEQENGGYAWEATRPRPTAEEAEELGKDWIDATLRYDAEIAALKEERARELPGQLANIKARMGALEEEKKDLGAQIKNLEVEAWNLVKDANNPQARFDFLEPWPEQQELVDDDDEPVADANGRHPDGPKPEGRKDKKRSRKKTPTNRADGARERHDDDDPLPDWNAKSGIADLRAAATARGINIEGSPSRRVLLKDLQEWKPRPGLDPSGVEWPDGEAQP
jgi:hypothetical protein